MADDLSTVPRVPADQPLIDQPRSMMSQVWYRAMNAIVNRIVRQFGTVTAGHLAIWNADHILEDGGAPPGGTVTSVTASAPIASSGGTTPNISHNTSGVTAATYGSATQVPQVTIDATGHVTAASNVAISVGSAATRTIGLTVDGGGSVITTGVKGYVQVPVTATITGWTLLSTDGTGPATAGNIVFDIWKDTYTNYPPTVADTITASAKPTLSGVNKNTDSTLTGWTTGITAGDVLGFNVDSASTVTRVTLQLTVTT